MSLVVNNEGDISGFVDWLFESASKGAPQADGDGPAAAEPSTSSQPARDSPPHQAADSRRLPSGPRPGAPLYQQAINQAVPTTSPTSQKRTASARSPSPAGHPPAKSRRMDLPTGPRAMQRDRDRDGHGPRSLLDRMGPRGGGGHGPHFNPHDDVQARIDSITNGSPDPNMMMMNGGFPMNGMGGMDMAAMSMANPMMLQELMLNQMAMMSQIAGAMGIMNPATGQFINNGGFPMQPGMDMNQQFNGVNGGMGPGAGDGGRGRGRGRGGSARGAGRGRGGHAGHHPTTDMPAAGSPPAPATSAPAQAVAPTIPVSASAPAIVAPTPVTPSSSTGSARPGFVPPARPQSPTLCKFGTKCTNPICRYSHPSPVATAESGVVLSTEACEKGKDCKDKDCIKSHVSPAVLNPNAEVPKPSTYIPPSASAPAAQNAVQCRYGAACTRPGCSFAHPRPASTHNIPCKFGAACTRATCQYQHPEGRVLPTTFHRGLATTGPMVNVPNPEAGSMGSQSHHKSVTFKRPDGTPTTAAELEKKVKEMEERKTAAQKAIAQAQAGKKDDTSPAVPISA
ncbi:hypothetical protein L226DRAFT_525021 [Lentinus tigrinus ALCF2SS1-7]|uniref:uncharacterized protein n=1 Tax=Lentinus tigrinus ALCF2SS1-7 TaxID=1328758 RepID=UPI001165F592|nr:hypothetical protein L226DRAFT_525021 [Lentinus tigrinus ALCF2SS1-7]